LTKRDATDRAEPSGGESQRPTADDEARGEGYRDAAHRAASEAGKRARRARTPESSISRAKSVGMVSRAEYLTPDDERAALVPGDDGLPAAELRRVRDRLLVVTPAGMVNPKSRTAWRSGLHSFQPRGTQHHAQAFRSANLSPGAVIDLQREPENPHDAHAVALYGHRARYPFGYVPATIAKRLSPLLDAGTELVAVSTRGAGAGRDGVVPQVLVCERRLYDHLTRPATDSSGPR